jgi:hypothetical protein
LLYCFFIIELARRKILHFNLTATRRRNGCSKLPAALPEAGRYRYVILDRDAKFDDSETTFLQATGLTPKRTSVQAPGRMELPSVG